MQHFLHRLIFIVKSRLSQKKEDPLKTFEAHVSTLEKQLNNVAVSLSKFKAHENVIRSDLEAVLIKIDKTAERLQAVPEGNAAERQSLEELKQEYQSEAIVLGQKLEPIEDRRVGSQTVYLELRTAIQVVGEQLEAARARYYSAETKQSLYGDASGLANADGRSKVDHLFERIKTMEAEAASFYALSPVDMKIDREARK